MAAALCATSASAQTASQNVDAAPKPPIEKERATYPQTTPAAGGLMIFIDPVTRQPRQPDAAEIQALRPLALPGPAPVERALSPGPGFAVTLDPSFDSYMVGTRRADGSFAMECVTGAAKAAEVMTFGARRMFAPYKSPKPEVLDVQ